MTLLWRRYFKRSYHSILGCLIGDSKAEFYSFSSLCGSSNGVAWSCIGPDQFKVIRGGRTTVAFAISQHSSRPWIWPLSQEVILEPVLDRPHRYVATFGFPKLETVQPEPFFSTIENVNVKHIPEEKSFEFQFRGTDSSFRLPDVAIAATVARYRASKIKTLSVAATCLSNHTKDENHIAAVMAILPSAPASMTASLSWQPLFSDVDPSEGKPMSILPATEPAYLANTFGMVAPIRGKATEIDTIQRRIIKPRSSVASVDEFTTVVAGEFLARITASLNPVDEETVLRQMNRPSQRANQASVSAVTDILRKNIKRLFLKSEVVACNKPARNICTVSTPRLLRMARYTLSAAQHMQTFPFWVWGVGSGATARLYHKLCNKNDTVVESDFSKFDASMGPWFAEFNRKFILSLFPTHETELIELLDDVDWQTAVTNLGIKFSYGIGRMTGVNETTLFNTVDQAFLQYLSVRQVGFDKDKAWRWMMEDVLVGGDDGIVGYVGQNLAQTAKEFGMVVEQRSFPSETPCRFLGRIYLNGKRSEECFQDLADFVQDFHMVNVGSHGSIAQGLVNKATGLWVTDYSTPIIRDFCLAVFKAFPALAKNIDDSQRWWIDHYDRSDPFVFGNYNHPDEALSYTSKQLNCPNDFLEDLIDFFRHHFSIGATPPQFTPPGVRNGFAFEIDGVPFGPIPAPAPVLEQITRKQAKSMRDEARDCVTNIEMDPDNNRMVKSLIDQETALEDSSLGPDALQACSTCGLYHLPGPCLNRRGCKICGDWEHTANKCTRDIEQSLGLAVIDCSSKAATNSGACGLTARSCPDGVDETSLTVPNKGLEFSPKRTLRQARRGKSRAK